MRRSSIDTGVSRVPASAWSRKVTLWAAFVIVHLAVAILCLIAPGQPMGDVDNYYAIWAHNARTGAGRAGIDFAWVYPILAFVPMALADAIAVPPLSFGVAWLLLMVGLNAAAFAVLLGQRSPSRSRVTAAYWWLGFTVVLGPIALARIDTVTVPLVIVAALIAATRPRVAALLITAAAWIKVWPVAAGIALVTVSRRRVEVILVAVLTSCAIMLGSLLAGAGTHVVSFITEQTARGVQVEAPAAMVAVWGTMLSAPGAAIVYSQELNTFQVTGPGVEVLAEVLTPALALAILAIAALGIRAVWAGATFGMVFASLFLALVAALIAFNKVGSPQFIVWLAAPVIVGLVHNRRLFAFPAVAVFACAALTGIFYPYLYTSLLVAEPLVVALLTVRNVLELVILAWAVQEVWRVGSERKRGVDRYRRR